MQGYSYAVVLTFLVLLQNFRIVFGNEVKPLCGLDSSSCELWLTLGEHRMMTLRTSVSGPVVYTEKATFHANGSVSIRNRTRCGQPEIFISKEESSKMATGDGSFKLAYLFNNSLPGPPIIVYRGQELIVHMRNDLMNEGTTVHWHGITQRNTPWMDGVEGLTQCIINPGKTFTYRFVVPTAGTFWYHTHASTQRTMGAYGPLIVLPRNEAEQSHNRGDDPLPEMAKEFYMMVSDWFERSSKEIQQIVENKAISYLKSWDFVGDQCFSSNKAPDGLDSGVVPFQSALINGKGFHYTSADGIPENQGLPVEEFRVQKGGKYRFRMIGSAMAYMFRVSIDNHKLHVIATDGGDVVSRMVDYIIIASGERYDFWIEATDPAELGLYWIRVETYEMYNSDYEKITASHTEAILRYTTMPTPVGVKLPRSEPKKCTREKQCEILNCPFKSYGHLQNITCLPVTELQATQQRHSKSGNKEKIPSTPLDPPVLVEHFLNFHMMLEYTPGLDVKDLWTATINGNRNKLFPVPPLINPRGDTDQRVRCDCPTHEVCTCNHVIDVPLGSLVQLVILVTVSNPIGVLNGLPHNVHLHGYSFEVVKIGYPTYDNTTSFYKDRNQDIACSADYCSKSQWANSSWSGGNVPGTVDRPPVKDTILVPIGGYAVVQFRADNPGYWFMHCHTEFHTEEGMSLVMKVGNKSEMAPPPGHMTDCANTDWPKKSLLSLTKTPELRIAEQPHTFKFPCERTLILYKIITTGLVVCTALLFFLNMSIVCKWYNKHGYTRLL